MSAPNDPEAVLSHTSTLMREVQRQKHRNYYLKGPVRFGWIMDNIPDPTSRVILFVQAFMDMEGTNELALGAKVWECAGITDRYHRRRVLNKIRDNMPNYRIINRTGRPSVIKHLEPESRI